MADVVRGKFCILYMKLGSVYYPIACTRTVEVAITAETIELAPRSSNDFREFDYGRKSGTISGTGLTKVVTAPENLYTIFDLMGYQLDSQKLLVKFVVEDPSGNIKVLEVNTLITGTGLSKDAGSILGQNFTLLMTGRPVISTTPVENTNPQILIYEYTATGGESGIDLSGVVVSDDATMLIFYKNGSSKQIIDTPTGISGDQVNWDAATKEFTFLTFLAEGDYIKIIYIDQEAAIPASTRSIGDGDFRVDGAGDYRDDGS